MVNETHDPEDLDKIFHYYQTLAPDALPAQNRNGKVLATK
jgi:hypothetical protein